MKMKCKSCGKAKFISAFRKRDLEEQVCKVCRPTTRKYNKCESINIDKKWLERG